MSFRANSLFNRLLLVLKQKKNERISNFVCLFFSKDGLNHGLSNRQSLSFDRFHPFYSDLLVGYHCSSFE